MATRRLFDGATIEIGQVPIVAPASTGNIMWIKIAGVWKQAITWIKVAGVWKQTEPKIKISGVWR
jgi:hypothetical protein